VDLILEIMEDTVIFKDKDQTKLIGLLAEVDKKKIIILVHGFRGSKEGKTVTRMMKEIAPQGISTFRFDLFAHGASDGKFEDLTVSKAADGIISAIVMLKQMGFEKIGIMGVSFGGICALIAARESKEIQYLVLKSPISDYKSIEEKRKNISQWEKEGKVEVVTKAGKKYTMKWDFIVDAEKNNAHGFGKEIQIPVFIVHGDEDVIVPVQQSEKLNLVLPNSTLEIIKGADHFYHKSEDFEKAIHLMVDFVLGLLE
jgi:uncharacterized protein